MSSPPWHLWGATKRIHVVRAVPKGIADDPSAQLVQVNYGRPENWRFLAWAKIVDSNTAEQSDLVVKFNLLMGIGLASITFPLGFFRFDNAAGLTAGMEKWTTSFEGPSLDDTAESGTVIDHFPAQLAVIQVETNFVNGVAARFVDFQVGFWVAPNVHVRPEWHSVDPEIPQFAGAEHKGQ